MLFQRGDFKVAAVVFQGDVSIFFNLDNYSVLLLMEEILHQLIL